MTTDSQLRDVLARVFFQAIDDNWEELKPLFQTMAWQILKERQRWEWENPLHIAINAALDQAIKTHTSDTFAPVVDAIAKEKVRQQLAKALKARGMETTLLDSIP